AKHGVFAREACGKCGRLLGAVRFTRRGEAGEWCSRECRGEQPAMLKPGRPRKYRNGRERRAAKTCQQRTYRSVLCGGKNCLQLARNKPLTGVKMGSLDYPLTPPA